MRTDWRALPLGAVPRHIPLVECPVCGKSAEPYTSLWLGPIDDDHPANVFIHGGVYYGHNPYPWVGDLDWSQWLAIREECTT